MTSWNSPGSSDKLLGAMNAAADDNPSLRRVGSWPEVDTGAILDLIHGDPIHARDRAKIVETIVAAGREHRLRFVDPNAVRARLAASIEPHCVGPVYHALRRRGVLQAVGWTTSTDKSGRNAGRPARLYRLAESWSGD